MRRFQILEVYRDADGLDLGQLEGKEVILRNGEVVELGYYQRSNFGDSMYIEGKHYDSRTKRTRKLCWHTWNGESCDGKRAWDVVDYKGNPRSPLPQSNDFVWVEHYEDRLYKEVQTLYQNFKNAI